MRRRRSPCITSAAYSSHFSPTPLDLDLQLPDLPVSDSLPALLAALGEGHAVLQAPPGAGKTTLVPLALLNQPWLANSRIVMLEPRRLAARAAARRMATLLSEPVGQTVGYRVRRETRISGRTKIEVVTEGVLTRLLVADPTLDGVGIVIFDEFHERSIHGDTGFALTLYAQRALRPDLRILVMSATLATDALSRSLGTASVITSLGALFPVRIVHAPPREGMAVEAHAAQVVQRALKETSGDVLAFLPGEREIGLTLSLLQTAGVEALPLYGNLPLAEQDRVLQRGAADARRIVLATDIAESSLTIEGVQTVVDAGLARVPRASPRTGMTRLDTVRVSRASATQRAGRAGRLAPGVCYRLWSLEDEGGLLPFSPPEILNADLTPLALDLAMVGVRDATELPWIDPPPAGPLSQARTLLRWLGALDEGGAPTPHGAAMARLGTHPRLAHALLAAKEAGHGALACDLVPLLEGRDVLRPRERGRDADLRTRLELVRRARRGEPVPADYADMVVARDAVARAAAEATAWRVDLGVRDEWRDTDAAGVLVAQAFPDRVGQRRTGALARFVMRNGAGAALRDSPGLSTEPYLAIAETDGRAPEAAIYLAAPLSERELRHTFDGAIERRVDLSWEADANRVIASESEVLGAIVLSRHTNTPREGPALLHLVLDAVHDSRLTLLPWNDGVRALQQRLIFLHRHLPEWPAVEDEMLLSSLDEWLAPYVQGMSSSRELKELDLAQILLDRLSWKQRSDLAHLAPTHVEAPTGSRLAIDYADASAPIVRVRLQEMFGVSATPTVLGGKVALTLHLLSPAQRPIQITQDLAGFWRSSYGDVRKEMKGRYPRHPWPDDPLSALPTRRAKPRT